MIEELIKRLQDLEEKLDNARTAYTKHKEQAENWKSIADNLEGRIGELEQLLELLAEKENAAKQPSTPQYQTLAGPVI